jgi:transcriptional/translational regulatory protein YebC/TACO1
MPKANMDMAIARGQGKSTTGQKLETLTIEAMMPASVAVVIDVESDNRKRSLQDVRMLIKKYGGTVAPTAFLFSRRGRTVLRGSDGADFDDVLMQALEAGAEDVEQDEDNNIVLWTQPSQTHQAAESLAKALSTEVVDSDIIWAPAADSVKLDDEEATANLGAFLAGLQDLSDVQAVYANAERGAASEEAWRAVEENLDS